MIQCLADKYCNMHIENYVSCKRKQHGVNDFRVLQRCVDETECKIAEAFHIMKTRPAINKQLFVQGSLLILRVLK